MLAPMAPAQSSAEKQNAAQQAPPKHNSAQNTSRPGQATVQQRSGGKEGQVLWQAVPGTTTPQRAQQTDLPRARQALQLGLTREQAGDWEAALEAYADAVAASQGTLPEALARRELARSRGTARRIERAESEALAGRFREAAAELRAALAMDPNHTIAHERLEQLRPQIASAEERAAQQRADMQPQPQELAAGPVRLKPRPGTQSFRIRERDLREAYEEIARAFGVRATFDEEVKFRAIRFDAQDVNFETAMTLLGHQSGTFWVALDEHTFLVAPDNSQKRRELEPVVVRTIVLENSTRPEEMQEMVRLVREMIGTQRVQLDARSHTITLRDTPENAALAVRLVRELEQARGEMMLEIEILEVDRDSARQLGVTPPTSAQVFTLSPQDIRNIQNAATTEDLLRILRDIFGLTPSLSGVPSAGSIASLIPPLIAIGGGKSILFATLPGAAAQFSQAFSAVRGARRLLLRSSDGQPATFFAGDRFPVTLATLSPSFLGGQLPVDPGSALRRNDIPAGEGPSAVISGDFNGDGNLDLAVTNEVADTVSIFIGIGDGKFNAPVDFPVGRKPMALVAADFTADGNLDLAVVNNGEGSDPGSITILIGDGAGSFAPGAVLTAGTRPIAIFATALTSSGRMDLIVANFESDTLSIFLGNGGGAFTPAADVNTGNGPRAVTSADFDGDGNADLAVVNEIGNTLQVFLGNGAGGFGTPTERATGNAPRAIAIGDLDSLLRTDLVVANSGDDTVSTFLNLGNGNFGARTDIAVGAEPSAIVVADFTRDGTLDVVTANTSANTVTLLVGSGGFFLFRTDLDVGDAPVSLDAADFDKDGRPDVVTANRDADSLTVILNSSSFSPTFPGFNQPYPASVYEDIGLKVKTTPRLHPDREVTLQLEIELRSLAGQDFNGVPVISNRKMEQTIRLREDETTVLSGILQNDETLGLTGWPGLAGVPLAGYAVGQRNTSRRQIELIVTITPRRLRLGDRVDRSFYAGRGDRGPGGGGGGGGAATNQPPRNPPQQ